MKERLFPVPEERNSLEEKIAQIELEPIKFSDPEIELTEGSIRKILHNHALNFTNMLSLPNPGFVERFVFDNFERKFEPWSQVDALSKAAYAKADEKRRQLNKAYSDSRKLLNGLGQSSAASMAELVAILDYLGVESFDDLIENPEEE